MLDSLSPLQALAAGAALGAAALAPLAALYRRRAHDASAERRRADQAADRARAILAAAPDGIFLWDHATGGITCSRRLAEMLKLENGTLARYDDIRACFDAEELQKLEQGVSLLRAKGRPFETDLARGDARFRAVGVRAEGPGRTPVADIVWLAEADHAAPPAQSRNASGLDDRHLTALLDALPIPLWLRDAELKLAFQNRAAERVRGLDAGLAERARIEGAPHRAPVEIAENGTARTVTVTETPLVAGVGAQGGGTIGFAVDADPTARPAATATPSPLDILRPLDVGVAVFDGTTALVAANRAFADLWRIDPEWLETRPAMSDILARLRELRRLPEVADFAAFRRAELGRFGGLDGIAEDDIYLPDGRTVRRRFGPLDDGGLVMTCEDVSGKLDLQRSLKSMDRVQRTTLENLREGIAVFTADGRLGLINPQMLKLWDLGENDLRAGARLGDVIAALGMRMAADDEPWPERKERIAAEVLARTLSTGRVELVNGRILAFANIPLPDGATLVSYGDITDSHRVEEALRERARTLAEADRMKTEFIANVAMEVRTPLNTITGFADMLRQELFGELNQRQAEYADGILDTAHRMMGVVADILDLATIEAGRVELEMDTIDPHALLVGAFNMVKERARHKNIRLDFDCPPDIGWITADARRLTQAVFNLLTNAITFTPKLGHVTLSAKRDGDWLEIAVADNGPGIPKDDRARVLAAFGRIRDDAHQGEGPGLGLTIVDKFVALHGGGVEIRANKARGTTVVCRLPVDGENTSGVAPFDTDHAIVSEKAAE